MYFLEWLANLIDNSIGFSASKSNSAVATTLFFFFFFFFKFIFPADGIIYKNNNRYRKNCWILKITVTIYFVSTNLGEDCKYTTGSTMAAVLVDGPSLPFASIESVLFRGTVSKVQQNIIYNPPSSCYLILISYVLLTLFRKPATRRFPEALWYHEHLRPAVLTSSVQARVAWRVQRVVVGTFLSSSLVHCISLACVPHLPLRWKGPGCATRCPS